MARSMSIGATESSLPLRMPPIEYGGMMRICRAATVEKKEGRIAKNCAAADAPGMLHMLIPKRCIGVVKYCARMGVVNLARSIGSPN